MRLLLARLALIARLISPAAAAVQQTDIFVAGQDGYSTYRIPAIIRAQNGTLLALCEGRKTNASDRGDIDMLIKRSTDGGRTWGPPQLVWDDGENTCGNPCPVVDETTGTVWLFGTHNLGADHETDIINKRAKGTRTPWLLRSDDHGKTWSRARAMASALKDSSWGWYATGPGIGIQIKFGPHAGRLVVPCDHSYDDPKGTLRAGPYEYGSHVLYSDDHGRTWKLGGTTRPKTNECQVVEVTSPPGKLLLNMRSYREQGCRAESFSWDGGLIWTAPQDQPALIEPKAQASLLRFRWPVEQRAGILLFSNPADAGQRVRMTVRLSADDGQTWPRALVLHEEFSAYSSLVSLSDTEAGCLYERGHDSKAKKYERITFARFNLQDLEKTP
ncbi:MAG: sialidase family protein [Opitutaceae bacterium]|nr:sialidase family protein [Opitutaceae bacterium]